MNISVVLYPRRRRWSSGGTHARQWAAASGMRREVNFMREKTQRITKKKNLHHPSPQPLPLPSYVRNCTMSRVNTRQRLITRFHSNEEKRRPSQRIGVFWCAQNLRSAQQTTWRCPPTLHPFPKDRVPPPSCPPSPRRRHHTSNRKQFMHAIHTCINAVRPKASRASTCERWHTCAGSISKVQNSSGENQLHDRGSHKQGKIGKTGRKNIRISLHFSVRTFQELFRPNRSPRARED